MGGTRILNVRSPSALMGLAFVSLQRGYGLSSNILRGNLVTLAMVVGTHGLLLWMAFVRCCCQNYMNVLPAKLHKLSKQEKPQRDMIWTFARLSTRKLCFDIARTLNNQS